jgi:3D-(3,5/4)-trihydroxycyclohexane-1,2-dione acylhydrolase (decyclizing)
MSSIEQHESVAASRLERARAIARAGGLDEAIEAEVLASTLDTTVAEALVLGLLLQDVRHYLCVLGHGSTEVGEVLRVYERAGLLRTYGLRSEIEASHAAAALRWVRGEKAAVVTSIGPGALQALAASLVPASNGLGVWYLLGDETTQDEGPNMQQIPGHEQGQFLRLFSAMGDAYSLHTPGALPTALRRGLVTVDHPHRAGPFFCLLPMNTQPAPLPGFNLDTLPRGAPPAMPAASDEDELDQAVDALLAARRVVVKIGGGARHATVEVAELLELADAVAVSTPIATGIVAYDNPRNMLVGGSKGTICGNYAMEEADLLVALGTRAVCQSDSSRTGYPGVQTVINVNADLRAALHYGRTLALVGDVGPTLARLNTRLREHGGDRRRASSRWLADCAEQRKRWQAFKQARYDHPTLHDKVWGQEVLTQPAAIKAATDWARNNGAVSFFDAGDVQANGFQVVEDDRPGRTFTETGASYMGFAASALLATGIAKRPFYGLALTGDGSFTMNPQILIDGVAHGARGCILLMDNRRMAAISSLQSAQYGAEHATWDHIDVDYAYWARGVKGVAAFFGGNSTASLVAALDEALDHDGLSLVHLPVYYGPDPLGGLGAFGRWNVGNWVEDTQALRHKIGL